MDSQEAMNVGGDTTPKVAGIMVVGAVVVLVMLHKLKVSVHASL